MTLDQIEELIRKYFAMGVTVVIILTGVQPAAGASATASPTATATATSAVPSSAAPPSATPTSATPFSATPSAAPPSSAVVMTIDPEALAGAASGSTASSSAASGAASTTGTTSATGAPDTGAPDTGTSDTGTADGTATTPVPQAVAQNAAGTDAQAGSAAAKFGWGTPNRVEDFSGGTSEWSLYDGEGHDGKGRRSPSAVSIANGVMTITGSPDGTTEGMAWNPGQKFGRWEARVKSPAGDPTYHAVLLLWPDAENWPSGGEVDFMEISDASRQTTDMFLHYGADNSQKSGSVQIDATQWHDWAVEWTPKGITAYVDGTSWWSTTDTSILPPGPMHMTIQLDWFPEGDAAAQQTQMSVDWVRQYPVGA